jgi:hypothetical protein
MGKLYLVLLVACKALAGTPPPEPCSNTVTDCRADFEASAYAGIAVDSFASAELNNYINPDASGILRERAVAGFSFEYRVLGDRGNPGAPQLWVYGETQHGVRSADIDCSLAANSTVPVCSGFLPLKPATQFIYMLRNATSLEAYTGARWEFPAIQRLGGNSARPYLNAQFGFLAVAGSGAGAIGMQHLAVGLVATTGRFMESHLEVGVGRTGLFLQPNSRLKVDAYLEWDSKVFAVIKARPFVQLAVDSDHGPGADSIETYIGLKFDLDKIF